jgi:hypothetical protein
MQLRKKRNNKKIALAIFVLLIVAIIPLYYFTRPSPLPTGVLLEVKGNFWGPQNFTLRDLQNLSPYSIYVNSTSSSKPQENGSIEYTGVQLLYILTQTKPFQNCSTLTLTASNSLPITINITESMQSSTVLAYAKNGYILSPLKNGGDGPLCLIMGDDNSAQIVLKDVVSITANLEQQTKKTP